MKSVILFCALAAIAGCHGDQQTDSSDVGKAADYTVEGADWLRPAPDSFNTLDAQKGKYSIEFHEVITHQAMAAVYSLSKMSFAEISPEVAKLYTGVEYKAVAGQKLYLVRAAFHPSGTGDYEVRKLGTQLYVLYSCLGHSVYPEKSAIVVALDAPPTDVFVEIYQIS